MGALLAKGFGVVSPGLLAWEAAVCETLLADGTLLGHGLPAAVCTLGTGSWALGLQKLFFGSGYTLVASVPAPPSFPFWTFPLASRSAAKADLTGRLRIAF